MYLCCIGVVFFLYSYDVGVWLEKVIVIDLFIKRILKFKVVWKVGSYNEEYEE